MKRSAFFCHVTAFVFYVFGVVIYGHILTEHITTTLHEIIALEGGGYELVPSLTNLDKVTLHIIAVILSVVIAVAVLTLLIKKKTPFITFAASVFMIVVAAFLASGTNLQEFMFARYTLGLPVGESRIYTVIKYAPFTLSSVAAVVSFVLDRTTKNESQSI